MSGQIQHKDYEKYEDLKWPIYSGCESVHILSLIFNTNFYDELTIDGIAYSGDEKVNQIVPADFTIRFISGGYGSYYGTNDGFILNWNCTEWGEWKNIDGTCNQERRPINNGTTTVGNLKNKKIDAICSKLLHRVRFVKNW